MTFENPLLFFLCALGVFNSLIFSLYLLFFKKNNQIPNVFLGLLLLMLTISTGRTLYVHFTEDTSWLILQIGLSSRFLIGLFLYYYLKSFIGNLKEIPRSWVIHIMLLFSIILVVGILKPFGSERYFWDVYFWKLIYVIWGAYLILSGIVLKSTFAKLFQSTLKLTVKERWSIIVHTANVAFFLANVIGVYFIYLFATLTFTLIFYAFLIYIFFIKNREGIFDDIPEKYGAKKLENVEAKSLLKQLDKIMNEKKLYKNANIKLNDIATELGISSHKLSQLLNDNLGKSFALYINELRIEETKRLLLENNQYTLEAIGLDAGFSSKSAFYVAFKKLLGQTPSEFKNNL